MAKQYEDSIDFTADLERAERLLQEFRSIVGQTRWSKWMESTDVNFGTDACRRNIVLRFELEKLIETFRGLEDELHAAG